MICPLDVDWDAAGVSPEETVSSAEIELMVKVQEVKRGSHEREKIGQQAVHGKLSEKSVENKPVPVSVTRKAGTVLPKKT
jgi:hypothetical protein